MLLFTAVFSLFDTTTQLFEQLPWFFYLTVGLLSLTIGSFLNVVIYRTPKIMEYSWYHDCREYLADEVAQIKPKNQAFYCAI